MIIGCDLGNKSTNGLALIDSASLSVIDSAYILYDKEPYYHRKDIISIIRDWIEKYNLGKDDYILFERINLYRGGYISKLSNITSLAFLQATIINEFSEVIGIAEVNVQTWKADVLGSKVATKEDALRYVGLKYPNVNLKIIKETKRTRKEIMCHDLADACCIAEYGIRNPLEIVKNKVNFT